MIKQTTAALIALALSLSAQSETLEQTSTNHFQPIQNSSNTKIKPTKTIDLTKNLKEPLFAEVIEPSQSNTENPDKKITASYDFTTKDPLANVDFGTSTPQKLNLSAENDVVAHSSAITKATSYTVRGKKYRTLSTAEGFIQEGKASWYGPGFHGRKTASGEVFNMNALTAAHKRLPLGSRVKVTNLANGKSVVVRITDRGPFHGNRVIDLSKAAAKELGVLAAGTADVSITALK